MEWERSVQPLAVAGYRFIQDNTSSDDDVPPWTPISGSDSNTSSHNVTGLTEGDTYNFAVRAFNSQGDSDSSNSLSVTIVAAPAAPTGVHRLRGRQPCGAELGKSRQFVHNHVPIPASGERRVDRHPGKRSFDHLPPGFRPDQRHRVHLQGPRGERGRRRCRVPVGDRDPEAGRLAPRPARQLRPRADWRPPGGVDVGRSFSAPGRHRLSVHPERRFQLDQHRPQRFQHRLPYGLRSDREGHLHLRRPRDKQLRRKYLGFHFRDNSRQAKSTRRARRYRRRHASDGRLESDRRYE